MLFFNQPAWKVSSPEHDCLLRLHDTIDRGLVGSLPPVVACVFLASKAGVAVDADLAEARRCIVVARQRAEDVTVGVKYLSMILKHPDVVKYRTLKISNR